MMDTRILVKVDSSIGYSPVLEGVCSTFSEINGGIYIWDSNTKSAYDVFYECRPEILICLDRSITPSLSNVLKEYEDTKMVAIGGDIPDHSSPTLTCYPNASGDASYDLQPAANLIDYPQKPAKEKYKSEISTISDNENSIINGLSNFSVKCFSYTKKLKYANYVGKIFPNEISSILSSSMVYLDTDGHNDLLLAAMANNCACFSANRTIFTTEYMPRAGNLKELIDCLKTLIFQKSFRKSHIDKCNDFVMNNHTYFHRVSDIASLLGYKEHSENCISKIEERL